ncbi:hypothetical protein FA95DRAFT_1610112 [Auriscalpium vulgare]|uniref:Uncharacterized protein n=1 Tax=Auriscalpium vulgare TaxID=40419 RepID=A0ACB8RG34_9AGAM|nr:hypothetical protein FA95DRAFT_1610112 [Auriscalpium vulgare]
MSKERSLKARRDAESSHRHAPAYSLLALARVITLHHALAPEAPHPPPHAAPAVALRVAHLAHARARVPLARACIARAAHPRAAPARAPPPPPPHPLAAAGRRSDAHDDRGQREYRDAVARQPAAPRARAAPAQLGWARRAAGVVPPAPVFAVEKSRRAEPRIVGSSEDAVLAGWFDATPADGDLGPEDGENECDDEHKGFV